MSVDEEPTAAPDVVVVVAQASAVQQEEVESLRRKEKSPTKEQLMSPRRQSGRHVQPAQPQVVAQENVALSRRQNESLSGEQLVSPRTASRLVQPQAANNGPITQSTPSRTGQSSNVLFGGISPIVLNQSLSGNVTSGQDLPQPTLQAAYALNAAAGKPRQICSNRSLF